MSLFLIVVVLAVLVLPRAVRWLKPPTEPDTAVRV
jgi:hypothetical protein